MKTWFRSIKLKTKKYTGSKDIKSLKYVDYKNNYIILGAGAPHAGNSPTALREPSFGKSVLEWILEAYGADVINVIFVAGYRADEIKLRYKSLKVVENIHWRKTGSFHSLLLAKPEITQPLYVSYGDVLFRKNLITEMNKSKADITIAYDSLPKKLPQILAKRERVIVRDREALRLGYDIPVKWSDGEFIGVVKFSVKVLDHLLKIETILGESSRVMNLSDAIEFLRGRGFNVHAIDVAGEWAEVRESRDIAHFVLGTKAETLSRLSKVLQTGIIQNQVSFSVSDWNQNHKQLLDTIREKIAFSPETKLIVRSSSKNEDTFKSSNAGGFESVLDVNPKTELEDAVKQVIHSYGVARPEDQILVQPMLGDVLLSGVALTRTMENQAPWYVINYETNASTEGITSGTSKNHLTLCVRRNIDPQSIGDPNLTALLTTILEIEDLLGYDALDIEFALTRKGQVYIFQVRPLRVSECTNIISDGKYFAQLKRAEITWENLETTPPMIPGIQKPLYGIMPDWNPAEIIGTAPGALATSLYEFLIMEDTWATQRAEYGYTDVRPSPLLVQFAGRPYVDVRASFASFIPASIDKKLASRLLSFYLDWLRSHPELHDKVEFEVVPTCLASDFPFWKNRLIEKGGFMEEEVDEIRTGLYHISSHAFSRRNTDYDQIEILSKRHLNTMAIVKDPLERAFTLLNDCRHYGALPFAHLARSAFIAITLLRGAERMGIISPEANKSFLSTIRTVSHTFKKDALKVNNNTLSWNDFISKYGHLRPGTYEINSPRYDEEPKFFLQPLVLQAKQNAPETDTSETWLKERPFFLDALREMGLPNNAEEVDTFLKSSIQGREYAKFILSRSLSDALEALKEFGETRQLDSSTLSDISLADLLSLRDGQKSREISMEKLRQTASQNEELRKISELIKLPAVLSKKGDLEAFTFGADLPNFIGQLQIFGKCIEIEKTARKNMPNLKGKIALIPQADPGFDWLFGQDISGLVTMFGGANSHMAIRSAEFGLTAAIGVGEKLYYKICKAQTITINPANKIIRILS